MIIKILLLIAMFILGYTTRIFVVKAVKIFRNIKSNIQRANEIIEQDNRKKQFNEKFNLADKIEKD